MKGKALARKQISGTHSWDNTGFNERGDFVDENGNF